MYVDSRADTVRALLPDGSPDPAWQSPRGLSHPIGICATADGRVFVVDAGAHRVVQLDGNGAVVSTVASFGHGGAHLCEPSDVAVDEEMIVVTDTGNARVQLYDLSGAHLRSIGGWGNGAGEMVRPVGVAIHGEEIFVCDEALHRINVYSTGGGFVRSFASLGEQDGLLLRPSRIDIRGGVLYVSDSRNHRVQGFDPGTGDVVGRWGGHSLRPREHAGKLETPTSVTISLDGKRAAVCEPTEGRIQVFDLIEPRNTPAAMSGLGTTHFDRFMAGGADTIVLSSPDLQTVEVYDLSGVRKGGTPIMVTRFGAQGWGFGRFARIGGLAFDEEKQLVYVTDSAQRRLSIWKLDRKPGDESRFVPTMARLVQTLDFTALREADGRMQQIAPFMPGAIATDGNRIAIADERSGAVVVLASNCEMHEIHAPLMDRSGCVRQVDTIVMGKERLFSFDAQNGMRTVSGLWRNHVEPPRDPAIAHDITWIYLNSIGLDRNLGSIQWLEYRDHMIDWTHGPGTPGGVSLADLFEPTDILAHGGDLISVLDYANHRVLFFNTAGEPVSVLGARPFVMDAQAELKAMRKARETE